MNNPALEAFLARLYVDGEVRSRFLIDPRAEAARAGLTEEQCQALEKIDRVGLEMAARSFANKRSLKRVVSRADSRWLRIRRILARLRQRCPRENPRRRYEENNLGADERRSL